MTMTTGAILRRILKAHLSFSAHKLATIILDGTSWKDGYNGLKRGTASFQLCDLMNDMGISRQHLSTLLAELEGSSAGLTRVKSGGKFSPWIFRWQPVDNRDGGSGDAPNEDDTSPCIESLNKNIFTGSIAIGDKSTPLSKVCRDLIEGAKAILPCCEVAAEKIWEGFQAFNRAKGNTEVPTGYLLGFMRKWQVRPAKPLHRPAKFAQKPAQAAAPQEIEALRLAAAAPSANWQFHRSDLLRLIGVDRYEGRIRDLMDRLGVNRFAAMLAVHGEAALAGELRG